MSKYPVGRYTTGEVKYVYFRKLKFGFLRNKYGLIRKKFWIAYHFKVESAWKKWLIILFLFLSSCAPSKPSTAYPGLKERAYYEHLLYQP